MFMMYGFIFSKVSIHDVIVHDDGIVDMIHITGSSLVKFVIPLNSFACHVLGWRCSRVCYLWREGL